MKKIVASIIIASLMASTPSIARDYNDNHREYNQKRHKKKSGCGWLCGAIIGGVVVGALTSRDRDYRDRDYDNRYYPPDYRYDSRYCVREQITEWYRGERYVYWETRCN